MTVVGRFALLRQVVRGAVDVARIGEVGVRFVAEPRFELHEPVGCRPYVPELADVAAGLVTYWARGGDEAQTWANVMLGASNTFDLLALERTYEGDLMLAALWCIAGALPVDDTTIDIARMLAG